MMQDILFLLLGALFGGAIIYFYQRTKIQNLSDVDQAREKFKDISLTESKQQNEKLENQLRQEQNNAIQLNRELASRESELKNLHDRLLEQKQEIAEIQTKFSLEFKNLANEIFEEKSKKFTDQNKVNLDEILKPLSEKILAFEKKVEDTNKESIARNSALREQITGLRELNIQITKEAENLTKALKGDSKTQGNWGEMILEKILENSGLNKNEEYAVQESFIQSDGRRLQPDVIVKLPDNKNIIIDSKVSLTAYEKYINADSTSEKEAFLKEHMQSVRGHLKNLNSKNYQNLYGISGLDFVLMFIPIESAFGITVQNDTQLFADAYEKNIVIVSPTTLMATLRTIANIWKNEMQNRNAMEIAKQSGDLYDKFVGFTDDLISVGKQITLTQNTYSEAMKKLSEGKGNLVRRAEKIRELGAMPGKKLDQRLIDRSQE